MQLHRVIAVAIVALACAAPAASARPAVDREPVKGGPGEVTNHAMMAAHRDAITTQQWLQAEHTAVEPIAEDTGSGWSFPGIALILAGATVLSVVLVQVVGKSGGRRRGSSTRIA